MGLREEYYQFGLEKLGFKSKKDVYENLYLKAIVDSYNRIDKTPDLENEIRDRFVLDLERKNVFTKDYIQNYILQLDFERGHFVSETKKRRTDIVFSLAGFDRFIFECKRLFSFPSKNAEYINEGLKRFVELQYSENESYAGMIGFVVSGNIFTITDHLMGKIKEYSFVLSHENLLRQKCADWQFSFQSMHNRVNNTKIHIYHLFFEFLEK